MKQTTLTQRLLSALVALCMVLSVCAPALAAEPEIGSAAMITLTKGGTTTGLTPGNVAKALPQCTMSVNGSKVTLNLSSNTDGNLLSDAVLTAVNPGTDLELVCGYRYVTAIANPVVITGMHNITLSGYGMAGSLKIENCNGEVSLTAQYNRVVLGSLNIDNTAGNGGVTITSSHLYPLCNDAGGNTVIASNGPVKIENTLALLAGVGALVGPATRGSLSVTQSSSVEVTGASGDYATIIGNADITSDGAVTITNAQGTAVGGKLTVNAGGAVTVTGDTVDATKAAIAKGANITAGGSVNISNPDGIAVDGGLTVNNTSGDVTVTSKGEYALKGITTITSNGAVNITSNGGQVSDEKLTVNKSSGVTVTAVSDDKEAFLWGSNYTRAPRFVNTPKVEIWNKGNEGWVGMVEYVPPDGMGSVYYTSSASNAEKTHTHGTGDRYYASAAYFRIEPDTLYTLTLPEGVTAKTNGISDTSFYAGEMVTVTAPEDTDTKKFEKWTFSGTEPTDLPNDWQTSKKFTFTMPAGNVTLKADYMQLYNLTVTGGTIVNGTNTGNYLPGTEVTVAFTGSTGIEDQFEKWTGGENIIKADPADWQSKPSFSFTMPAGNVTLKAECKTVYNVSVADSRGTVLVNNEERSRALEGETVTVKTSDTFFNAYHQFNGWSLSDDSAQMVNPSEGWKTSKEFTFKMPAGNVTLTADYKQLYNLTVTGGTIVDESSDTGKPSGIYLPGTEVTIQFTESDDITKQFKQWKSTDTEPEAPTAGWPDGGWQNSKKFTFKMPTGNVTLEAEYKTVYNVSVDENRGTVLVNDEKRTQALEGETVTVKASDTFFNAYHQFNGWSLSDDSAQMVEPSENWQTSKEFTFKMPAGNVTLTADYKQLYDLTVNGGTIVDENGDTGETTGIYLPGTEVTIQFTESDDITKQFKQWKSTDTEPEAPTAGWPDGGWQNSKKFTFKMPTGNVTLEAEYKTVYNVSVDENRGTVLVNDEKRTQALEGETVTVKASDTFFDAYHEFDGWQLSGDSAAPVNPSEGWKTSKTFTFKMPAGNVTLKADCKQLYDLTVTDGTIVDESSDTGKPSGIYLPGTEVTIQFTESDDITKQFKQWKSTDTEPEAPTAGWPEGGWQNSKKFTFKMPAGDVSLRAEYRETYRIFETSGKAEFFVDGQQVHQAPAGVRVTVKLVDGFINDHREFDQWQPGVGTALVKPEEGWEHKPSFRFTMPEGDVELLAFSTTLYDLTVNGGTIVDGTGDTGTSQKIVKPGQLVTVRAESTEENPFLQWTYTGKAPVEPDDGWQTSKEFTFKMPNGNVTLDAQRDQLYKVSINDSLGSVTINGEPRSSLWVKEGETVTVATTLKDGYWMEFEKWNSTGTAPEEPVGGWTETNKSTSTAFTFKMPNGPVELVAQWWASSLDPDQHIDPDEPIDEDFGVEPAPMDTTGGTIAAVAVGGAAIWGGYEIATRVILHSLLPEGAAIPANRGQLALLVWNTAGRPEPAGAPAFTDVTDPDMAKAAQWCTEQGTMGAKGDRFEPEGWTPKFKVIEVWNKAFPAA